LLLSTILLILNKILFILASFNLQIDAGYLFIGEEQTQDPVRSWPTGVPQSWAILGAAIATYRAKPVSPRVKARAGFGALGISSSIVLVSQAIELQ
jgi:hypothetical protein